MIDLKRRTHEKRSRKITQDRCLDCLHPRHARRVDPAGHQQHPYRAHLLGVQLRRRGNRAGAVRDHPPAAGRLFRYRSIARGASRPGIWKVKSKN